MSVSTQTARVNVKKAETPKVYNVISPASAGTEFSQALDTGTKQLLIRCREDNELQFTYTSGESGSKYLTLKAGAVYFKDNLDLSGATLYMQTSGSSVTIEIEQWT